MNADFAALAGRPVIVGGGLAGLATALFLAPEPVVLIAKAPLGTEASSPWAQGGMAAAVGADDDAGLHVADTLAAGDGLCDPDAVARILADAPGAIAALDRLGVGFDRDGAGGFRLGLEAAHSRHRIVHADGDGTGREVIRALAAAVRVTPSITLLEDVEARRLLIDAHGAVAGVLVTGEGAAAVLPTGRVVLATGGIGGLYEESTNPLGSIGQGLAMAARAGAAIADPEFVQFHPTALATSARPMKLVSEAVRGEGAVLVDETGRRFMAEVAGAELAPRDVVARAIAREIAAGRHVFLDARERPGAGFAARFPAISALCAEAGLDPARDLIPVRPAAHYHMGGIAVDADGCSTVPGLWACGEVASTGLHGANRLASNSLVEAAVCAERVARSVAGVPSAHAVAPRLAEVPPAADAARVRAVLSRWAGVTREADGLARAVAELLPLAGGGEASADPALVGLMIATAAFRRRESRGAHCRIDYPERMAVPTRTLLTLADTLAAARDIAAGAVPSSAVVRSA
ncbi:L-aspartate oxidase [Segnochrobactrum spirostomi]|uniref:L-aspartate oxidase n=1 Tax=Segnochrobactrum spirostomi TaxID=2608987 RepID=A0A6A7Y8E2_9HYPH|nr:L-aspartate oxidase [Segnochrobactrum spirostomi]MQT14975.1 L-aspartate oxidase [Segnochrobactrum spirostomi]